jgi:hypothetical protein
MFEWMDGMSLTWVYLTLVAMYGVAYGAIRLLLWAGGEE